MLGDNIRKYRKMQNLSQERLAEILGVSRQSISLWETGKTQPSLDILATLASTLGVTIDALMAVESQNENSSDIKRDESAATAQIAASNNEETKKKHRSPAIIAVVIMLVIGIAFVGWKIFISSVPFVDDPKAIERVSQSVVMLNCYDKAGDLYATGSGFAMFEDGIIVTNYHVIEDNVYRIVIDTEAGASLEVDAVIASDEAKDIAILKCKTASNLELLEAGESNNLQKGEKVAAIGSPLGLMNTVSTGVFSGYVNGGVLQFTASISSGSSGGALLDNNGKVLGITYASFEAGQNLNLAIPIEDVIDLWQNRKSSDRLSMKHFYQPQTPTYTVEYVLEHYDSLDSRDFFVEGYVLSHSYQEWCDEENWDRREGWIEMCDNSSGTIVTIFADAKRDSFSSSGKIMEKYGIWYGAGEILDVMAYVEDGETITVGPISRYNLDNNDIRIESRQS